MADRRFDLDRLFDTCALGPAGTGPLLNPVMTKLIECMLNDPGLEADIFKTLDAAKELGYPGNSSADPDNSSDGSGNSSAVNRSTFAYAK